MVEGQPICLQRESLGFQTLNNELIFFLSLFQVSTALLMDVVLIKAFALEQGPSPHSCICFTAV